jgi:hypothetical protein
VEMDDIEMNQRATSFHFRMYESAQDAFKEKRVINSDTYT